MQYILSLTSCSNEDTLWKQLYARKFLGQDIHFNFVAESKESLVFETKYAVTNFDRIHMLYPVLTELPFLSSIVETLQHGKDCTELDLQNTN